MTIISCKSLHVNILKVLFYHSHSCNSHTHLFCTYNVSHVNFCTFDNDDMRSSKPHVLFLSVIVLLICATIVGFDKMAKLRIELRPLFKTFEKKKLFLISKIRTKMHRISVSKFVQHVESKIVSLKKDQTVSQSSLCFTFLQLLYS